jgi:SAM-dependent methyltransferase
MILTEKTALDLGCNQGGMLLEIAEIIKVGIGIDYDSRVINATNRISSFRRYTNLRFYVFDLEGEIPGMIDNFLPESVDIVFHFISVYVDIYMGFCYR